MKTIVLRWARISSRIRGWIAGQMLTRASGLVAGPPGCSSSGRISPGFVMSSIGTTTWRSSALRAPASTIVTSRSGPAPPRNRAIVSSGRWVALSPIRCGGVDPSRPAIRCSSRSRVSARWEPRFEPAIAWTSSMITCSTPREDLARLAREHQVQGFGRRDQDVRRAAGEVATVLRGRVAGAARDRDVRGGLAEAGGGEGDPRERRAEVPLDVVGQRLERADVEDADAPRVRLRRGGAGRRRGQPVQRPEKRREGLAAPGRGVDQRVAATADRGPALGLGLRRRREGALEPGADGGRERRQRIVGRGAGGGLVGRERHGGHGDGGV